MTLQQGDMIEISMTIESESKIYDTTNPEIAKKEGLEGTGNKKVVFGRNMLLPKVEEKLKDAQENEEFILELGVDDAFGHKDKEYYQTYPEKVFKEKRLKIQVGQVYNFDGNYGKIKSASRGRVLVDFNHPLAGKDVKITVSLQKVLTDLKEKVETCLNVLIGLSENMYSVNIEDKTITLHVPEQLAQMSEMLQGALREQLGDEIKDYSIEVKKLESDAQK